MPTYFRSLHPRGERPTDDALRAALVNAGCTFEWKPDEHAVFVKKMN